MNFFRILRALSSHPFETCVNILVKRLPYFEFIKETGHYQCTISFDFWFKQKILNKGGNIKVYWPVHSTSTVVCWERIKVGVDAYPGIMGGCYIQGMGGIEIGDYTQIAPNVVIVSSNHDVYDSRKHITEKIKIGKYCWLGAGCKIMPGVELGDFTIVGAGAVVTKSFKDGYVVIGGVPARKIKDLESGRCLRYELEPKFHGYIRSENFEIFRKKYLEF